MRCCNLSSELMGLDGVMADTVLADTGTDEGFLLALLNSTPVINGVPADDRSGPGPGLAGRRRRSRHRGRTAARAAGPPGAAGGRARPAARRHARAGTGGRDLRPR